MGLTNSTPAPPAPPAPVNRVNRVVEQLRSIPYAEFHEKVSRPVHKTGRTRLTRKSTRIP
jgi:hypothetical protein